MDFNLLNAALRVMLPLGSVLRGRQYMRVSGEIGWTSLSSAVNL